MNIKRLLLYLTILVFFLSCKKEESIPAPVPKDPYNDYHVEHNIGGEKYSFLSSDYSVEVTSIGFPSTVDGVDYFNLSSSSAEMKPDSGGLGGAKISFEGYKEFQSTYSANKKASIAAICSLGAHPLVYNPLQTTTSVTIETYYNSELYISYLGPQTETSSFVVSESVEMNGSQASQRVKGTYSCRLYKQSNQSEFIDVVDGKFYLYFSTP